MPMRSQVSADADHTEVAVAYMIVPSEKLTTYWKLPRTTVCGQKGKDEIPSRVKDLL